MFDLSRCETTHRILWSNEFQTVSNAASSVVKPHASYCEHQARLLTATRFASGSTTHSPSQFAERLFLRPPEDKRCTKRARTSWEQGV